MKEDLSHIVFKSEAIQSDSFGDQYKKYFCEYDSSTFNSPLFSDISSIYNSIMLKYTSLTEFQQEILGKLFNTFNQIRKTIDPNRLKSFEYYLNEDDELLLYRNTTLGLTNIIINPDELIAYSYLGKSDSDRILKFYNSGADFESIAYKFFSK